MNPSSRADVLAPRPGATTETVKAGDIHCPLCGAGFIDVAPDYELNLDGVEGQTVHGFCAGGHGLFASLQREGGLTVNPSGLQFEGEANGSGGVNA